MTRISYIIYIYLYEIYISSTHLSPLAAILYKYTFLLFEVHCVGM